MNLQNYYNIQKKIGTGENILNYDPDDIDYMQRPIGKAIYLNSEREIDNPKAINEEIPYWKQRCKCKHCGLEISKSYYSKHRRTKTCALHQKIHKKVLELIIKS